MDAAAFTGTLATFVAKLALLVGAAIALTLACRILHLALTTTRADRDRKP